MAQTVGSVPIACGKLEINPTADCEEASWVDISGEDQSMTPASKTRKSGEAYTLDGDGAIIQGGKLEPMDLVFAIVYTEIVTEAFHVAMTAFEAACGGKLCVRWSPKGGNAGDWQFTTVASVVTSFTYPPMDATVGGPILVGFTVKAPCVEKTLITS